MANKTRIASGGTLVTACILLVLRDTFTWIYERALGAIFPTDLGTAVMPAPATILGIVLGIIGLIVLVWPSLKKLIWPPIHDGQLIQVFHRHYKNETVIVDGHEFIQCTFENVTLHYQGGPYKFVEVTIPKGTINQVASSNPTIQNTLNIVRAIAGDKMQLKIMPLDAFNQKGQKNDH